MIPPGVNVFEVDRDLKVLFQMDRKLSQAAGIDHNLLSQMLDPKALAGIKSQKCYRLVDWIASGLILRTLGLDPKLPQYMGINLKTLGMDSKTSASSSTSAAAETGSKGSKITCFGRN